VTMRITGRERREEGDSEDGVKGEYTRIREELEKAGSEDWTEGIGGRELYKDVGELIDVIC
jgi:hypothetical protein